MKIGMLPSMYFEHVLGDSLKRAGDQLVSASNTGADAYLAWGWPEVIAMRRDAPAWHKPTILCIDPHPFAIKPGTPTTEMSRIIQINGLGATAQYAPHNGKPTPPVGDGQHDPNGHILLIGQRSSAEQKRRDLADAWDTPEYERWMAPLLKNPRVRFRAHPAVFRLENPGVRQATLAEDLDGCSEVITWNSTAGIHAMQRGYQNVSAASPHGWAHMSLAHLAGQEWTLAETRNGLAWDHVRTHLRQAHEHQHQ